MGILLNGIGVSKGIALGKAHILHRDEIEVVEIKLHASKIDDEIKRFNTAIVGAKQHLKSIGESISEETPQEVSQFIETHLLMLEDTMFSEAPIRIIRDQSCNAEWALRQQRDSIIQVFDAMEDAYLKTRKDDVEHIVQLIFRILSQSENSLTQSHSESDNWHGHIIIADDLSPADTIQLQHMGVAGYITETGGQLSHTAILARSLGIPAIVGAHQARRYIADGEKIIIDGALGITLGQATRQEVGYFLKKQRSLLNKRRHLKSQIKEPAITLCGETVLLQSNIDSEDDVEAMHQFGLDSVGLYRTEFMYMNRDSIPSEAEHEAVYTRLVKKLAGAPLTLRTVDLGADKQNVALDTNLGYQHNPALGLRGIRRCLHDPALIIPQLRAILRASNHGPINILIPMLTHVSEIIEVRQLLESIKSSLRQETIPFDENIRMGGMIEVPSAALTAHHLAEHLDFMSIGTNDLIQYTLAVDRTDDGVDYLFDPLSPAILMLVKKTIDTGISFKIPVSLCGEMAGNPFYTRLLLGLGLRTFSTSPRASLEIKNVLRNTRINELVKTTDAIINQSSSTARNVLLNTMNLLAT